MRNGPRTHRYHENGRRRHAKSHQDRRLFHSILFHGLAGKNFSQQSFQVLIHELNAGL